MDALGILQRNSLENKQDCSVLSIALVTSMLLQRFTAGIIRSGFFLFPPLTHILESSQALRVGFCIIEAPEQIKWNNKWGRIFFPFLPVWVINYELVAI